MKVLERAVTSSGVRMMKLGGYAVAVFTFAAMSWAACSPRRTVVGGTLYTAEQLKPPVVYWLVDRSGSMTLPINPADTQCPPGCGTSGTRCPDSCLTRRQVSATAVGDSMLDWGAAAQHGLMVFPSPGQACGAGSASDFLTLPPLSSDAEVRRNAGAKIAQQVVNLSPEGGTPTASALMVLRARPELVANPAQDAFVVLVTDGLPNCNEQNPNTCGNPATCQCTSQVCVGANCATGCLDEQATVEAVRRLREQTGAKVMVVGVGADVIDRPAAWVLNRLAKEGGLARTCPLGTDAECGYGPCDRASSNCEYNFEVVATLENARAFADRIHRVFAAAGLCRFQLAGLPAPGSEIEVRVGGAVMTEYTFDAATGAVTMKGDLCDALVLDPSLRVEFRAP